MNVSANFIVCDVNIDVSTLRFMNVLANLLLMNFNSVTDVENLLLMNLLADFIVLM